MKSIDQIARDEAALAARTTRTRSQNGRRSRAKGHAFERDVARVFAELYPGKDVRRCIAQTRTAKREGCDVEGTPYWIECKVGATADEPGKLDAALAQAERETDGRPPLVVVKVDRRQAFVYARLDMLGSVGTWGAGAPRTVEHARPPVSLTLERFVELVRS